MPYKPHPSSDPLLTFSSIDSISLSQVCIYLLSLISFLIL
uniref:Uncharacterized protein n=1 Tax=Ascaris lumbricoides TaxID=6252 RepID=A0A0M3IH73_ASCLU